MGKGHGNRSQRTTGGSRRGQSRARRKESVQHKRNMKLMGDAMREGDAKKLAWCMKKAQEHRAWYGNFILSKNWFTNLLDARAPNLLKWLIRKVNERFDYQMVEVYWSNNPLDRIFRRRYKLTLNGKLIAQSWDDSVGTPEPQFEEPEEEETEAEEQTEESA